MNLRYLETFGNSFCARIEQLYGRKEYTFYEKVVRRVVDINYTCQIVCYEQLYDRLKLDFPVSSHARLQVALARIERFNKYQQMPRRGFLPDRERKDVHASLCQLYRNYVIFYERDMRQRDLAASTIHSQAGTAERFLHYLQDEGAARLGMATEEMILGYFYEDGRQKRGHDISQALHNFFSILRKGAYPEECDHILSLLPKVRKVHTPYPFLDEREIKCLKAVLDSGYDYGLSLRDKAIVSTAMYTGLRSIDIAHLKLQNLDMEKETVVLVQHKTGVPLSLPILSPVGNAIYRYIKYERPSSEETCLFLSCNGRKGNLCTAAINNAACRVFDAAGIRMEKGRRGLHLLRHNVAIELLDHGENTTMVMSVLGHLSPDSVEHYLDTDVQNLKACSLDIGKWEVPAALFLDGILNYQHI